MVVPKFDKLGSKAMYKKIKGYYPEIIDYLPEYLKILNIYLLRNTFWIHVCSCKVGFSDQLWLIKHQLCFKLT